MVAGGLYAVGPEVLGSLICLRLEGGVHNDGPQLHEWWLSQQLQQLLLQLPLARACQACIIDQHNCDRCCAVYETG